MSSHEDFYTDLISIVAHDLKTPISAVKGFIELVQQAGPLNDQQQHFSERALQSLQRMERLVVDLLEYTRISSDTELNPVECDLGVLIRESVEMLEEVAAKREIQFNIEMDDKNGLVMGDVRLLSQVVNNLLSNAVKYNKDGGSVWVTVSNTEQDLQVDVRDSGRGIPPEDLPKVFERFFRSKHNSGTKIEGSGLGLAIVDAIIQKHGGRIWVESEFGEGTTFSFTLPRYHATRRTSESRSITANYYEYGGEPLDDLDDDTQEADDKVDLEIDSQGDAV